MNVRKLWAATWTRQLLTVIAVGLASVCVAQIVGWSASRMGASGELVGVPFGQAVILGALMLSGTLGLPKLCCGKWTVLGILVGAGTWMVAMAVTWGWTEALKWVGVSLNDQPLVQQLSVAGPAEFAFIAIVAGCWAPIVEEIYFRGWLLKLGREKMPGMVAVALIAVIFAVLHGDAIFLPGLLVAGIGFGCAALAWGMNSAIAAHITFNLITIIAIRGGWLAV